MQMNANVANVFDDYNEQGSHASGKSWIFSWNFQTWKVLEQHFGLRKSWKNILESHAVFL